MSTRLDPKELNTNQFLGKTKNLPRPVGPADGLFGLSGRERLAQDQRDWDQAKLWGEDNDRVRSERIAALDAKREAERDARRQESDGRFVDHLRLGYFGADPMATEAEFLADLPRIRRDLRVRAATADPAVAARPVRGVYGI